jgi:hypothetical protein
VCKNQGQSAVSNLWEHEESKDSIGKPQGEGHEMDAYSDAPT